MYCLFLRTKEFNMIDMYFMNKWDLINDISSPGLKIALHFDLHFSQGTTYSEVSKALILNIDILP